MGILKDEREKNQSRNVWTAGGKILYKDGNNSYVKLYYDQLSIKRGCES